MMADPEGVPPVGVLLHELLSCHKAEEARRFLSSNGEISTLFRAYLNSEDAFSTGCYTSLRDPEGAAELVALLSLQTATDGADAQASLAQQVASRAEPCCQLLAPHLGNQHVAGLLHLLAGYGQLEDVLPELPAAESYLHLLSVIGYQLRQHCGPSLCCNESACTLLTAIGRSVVAVVANRERELQKKAGALVGNRTAGRAQANAPSSQRLAPQCVAQAITSVCFAAPLEPLLPLVLRGELGAVQLLLAMLQLELLWAQLPPDKRQPLQTLPTLMQHGAALGAALGGHLSTAVGLGTQACTVAGSPSHIPSRAAAAVHTMALMQLLRASLAAVRAIKVAASSQLAFAAWGRQGESKAGRHRRELELQQQFVAELLRIPAVHTAAPAQPTGHPSPAADASMLPLQLPNAQQPYQLAAPSTLHLLWQLVEQHSAGSSSSSSIVARKACDLLLWSIQQPLPHLRPLLLPAALGSLPPLGQLAQLVAERRPFFLELARAVLACFSCSPPPGVSPPPPEESLQALREAVKPFDAAAAAAAAAVAAAKAGPPRLGPSAGASDSTGLHGSQVQLDELDGLRLTLGASLGFSSSSSSSSRHASPARQKAASAGVCVSPGRQRSLPSSPARVGPAPGGSSTHGRASAPNSLPPAAPPAPAAPAADAATDASLSGHEIRLQRMKAALERRRRQGASAAPGGPIPPSISTAVPGRQSQPAAADVNTGRSGTAVPSAARPAIPSSNDPAAGPASLARTSVAAEANPASASTAAPGPANPDGPTPQVSASSARTKPARPPSLASTGAATASSPASSSAADPAHPASTSAVAPVHPANASAAAFASLANTIVAPPTIPAHASAVAPATCTRTTAAAQGTSASASTAAGPARPVSFSEAAPALPARASAAAPSSRGSNEAPHSSRAASGALTAPLAVPAGDSTAARCTAAGTSTAPSVQPRTYLDVARQAAGQAAAASVQQAAGMKEQAGPLPLPACAGPGSAAALAAGAAAAAAGMRAAAAAAEAPAARTYASACRAGSNAMAVGQPCRGEPLAAAPPGGHPASHGSAGAQAQKPASPEALAWPNPVSYEGAPRTSSSAWQSTSEHGQEGPAQEGHAEEGPAQRHEHGPPQEQQRGRKTTTKKQPLLQQMGRQQRRRQLQDGQRQKQQLWGLSSPAAAPARAPAGGSIVFAAAGSSSSSAESQRLGSQMAGPQVASLAAAEEGQPAEQGTSADTGDGAEAMEMDVDGMKYEQEGGRMQG